MKYPYEHDFNPDNWIPEAFYAECSTILFKIGKEEKFQDFIQPLGEILKDYKSDACIKMGYDSYYEWVFICFWEWGETFADKYVNNAFFMNREVFYVYVLSDNVTEWRDWYVRQYNKGKPVRGFGYHTYEGNIYWYKVSGVQQSWELDPIFDTESYIPVINNPNVSKEEKEKILKIYSEKLLIENEIHPDCRYIDVIAKYFNWPLMYCEPCLEWKVEYKHYFNLHDRSGKLVQYNPSEKKPS